MGCADIIKAFHRMKVAEGQSRSRLAFSCAGLHSIWTFCAGAMGHANTPSEWERAIRRQLRVFGILADEEATAGEVTLDPTPVDLGPGTGESHREGKSGAHLAQPHCVTGCAVVAQREPPLLAVRAALSMISSAVGSFGHPPLGLRRYHAGLQLWRGRASWPQALIYWIFSRLSLSAPPLILVVTVGRRS